MFEPDAAIGAQAEAELEPLVRAVAAAQKERARRLAQRRQDGGEISRQVLGCGFARLHAQGADIDSLAATAAPIVELVRTRVEAAQGAGEAITPQLAKAWPDREAHAPLWAAARRLLHGAGAMDAVKDYFGADGSKLRVLSVVVNRPGQSWNSALFRDMDIETPSTAGFHIDTDSACVLKTVIYLDDVGPDQGPFGAIPTSHLWDHDGPDRERRRAHAKSSFVSRSAEHRRTFASLSPPMQVKAAFGGDIPEDSQECRELLQAEARMTGPRGQVNLFDPEAIHRGGLVQAGERVALIAGIRAVWTSPDQEST
jgi:hypothetical protein